LGRRGCALIEQNKLAESLHDLDKSVTIRTRLVEQEQRKDLANGLASSLSNRGAAFLGLGKLPEAVRDFDLAISILTRLFEREGRKDLANDLARSLTSLATVYAKAEDFAAAVKWQTKALEVTYDENLKAERRSQLETYQSNKQKSEKTSYRGIPP
jgi:tetratricopeptide (TPR) repeat protein